MAQWRPGTSVSAISSKRVRPFSTSKRQGGDGSRSPRKRPTRQCGCQPAARSRSARSSPGCWPKARRQRHSPIQQVRPSRDCRDTEAASTRSRKATAFRRRGHPAQGRHGHDHGIIATWHVAEGAKVERVLPFSISRPTRRRWKSRRRIRHLAAHRRQAGDRVAVGTVLALSIRKVHDGRRKASRRSRTPKRGRTPNRRAHRPRRLRPWQPSLLQSHLPPRPTTPFQASGRPCCQNTGRQSGLAIAEIGGTGPRGGSSATTCCATRTARCRPPRDPRCRRRGRPMPVRSTSRVAPARARRSSSFTALPPTARAGRRSKRHSPCATR